MKPSVFHLTRYRQIAALLWKYGRSDLARQMSAQEGFGITPENLAADEAAAAAAAAKQSADGSSPTAMTSAEATTSAVPSGAPAAPAPAGTPTDSKAATPENLANDLEALGPTFVKFGQVLAGRPDLLPEAYMKALARLQDNVKPFSYEEVDAIVMAELGVRISKAFSRFDVEPVAAASLGQVHRAALRDGRPVVVKVQRPNIRQQIAEDFEVLGQIASFLDNHTALGRRHRFVAVLDEFRTTIQQELNYEREAHNLIALGKNLKEFTLIQVPQPIPDYYTRSLLTMEEVQGRKITALEPIARLDMKDKGAPLAEEIFRAYLQQVCIDGLFHADPHPGNVFITDDGRIALIDLGMVGHTAPQMQENLLKILLAIGEGNGEAAAEIAIRMSQRLEEFSAPEFRRRISQLVALQRDQGLEQLNVGRSLLEVSSIAQASGLIVPSELVLLGKTMLQLDEVGRILDPTFDANASIRRNSNELLAKRLKRDLSQGSVYSTLLEMKDFTAGLPSRLNRIMDAVTNSELEVKIKSTDAKVVMDGMEKIANRITTGLILASLIIGASVMMRIETTFRLFGLPGLAILCFLAAAAGGFWLVITILLHDYQSRKKLRR